MRKIVNIELKASKEGEPLVSIWTKYSNDILTFKHFYLTTGFGVHMCNEFLRSLHTELDIKFLNFKQYNKLLQEVNNLCPLEI